jgi:hypothetical protein
MDTKEILSHIDAEIARLQQIKALLGDRGGFVGSGKAAKQSYDLPRKPGYEYFCIEMSGGCWEEIINTGEIALFLPNEIVLPIVNIVILLGK